ncbi:hypothetical protein HY604_00950 [Candidatus Peregrinibacteria bacterium]|nr:hypothetical protein [Candidatus Peregrinibacteria bacterium]
MSDSSKLTLIKELIESAQAGLQSAKQLLTEMGATSSGTGKKKAYSKLAAKIETGNEIEEDNIVEGVFNGETMSDKKGKEYPVPANYASKSKLIPGDVLKLTINPDGSFLYKQIGPTERKRVIGILTYEDGQYKVIANGKAYKVLLASVTYFKGEVGDKITLIIPEHKESQWGAIENVLPKDDGELILE